MILFDNPVIVIGGDHYNTLAAVRCFGKYHLKVVLVGADRKRSKISKSKFAKDCEFVSEDEEDIIRLLLSLQFEKRGLLIPCSDFAEYVIDSHGEELSKKYYIPGFGDEYSKVAMLMDKYEQKKFAEKHGIPMAETWKIELPSQGPNVIYPCILKPEVSAFGSKTDIRIVETREELEAALNNYLVCGYKEILCQRFLTKRYEACAYGVIPAGNKKPTGVVIRKIHENHGGSTAYAEVIRNADILYMVDKLNRILQQEGYTGLYDYEFLVCEDGIFLNEINFRQSGNGYALVNWGQPSPLFWALSVLGKDYNAINIKEGKRHVDDVGELIRVKHRKLSVFLFFAEIIRTHNCAVLNIYDLPGTIGYYKSILRK